MFGIFLDDWKKNIKKYDTIIIFDNAYRPVISKYIKSKNPDCKIIFYFWNNINQNNKIFLSDINIDEFCTFSKSDSEEYNIKYNPQFYTKNITLEQGQTKNEIIFLGRDKDRKDKILNTKRILDDYNVSTQIYIIQDEKDFIKYEDYLSKLAESKGILDIVNNEETTGLTVRALESVFLKKKLITNNENIVSYKFYNSNNIFIIGKDDNNKLKEFINTPYEEISQDIVEYYDYTSWLSRLRRTNNEL